MKVGINQNNKNEERILNFQIFVRQPADFRERADRNAGCDQPQDDHLRKELLPRSTQVGFLENSKLPKSKIFAKGLL